MKPDRWETIQAAFDELVALDVTSRASRLAALGDTDPELKVAVESLLAADAEASAHLAPLESGLLGDTKHLADPLNVVGRTVSHFEVQERLGAGGMGVVYRAHDARLGRAVALKFLLPHYDAEDAAAKARFLREAHAAAALDHVNLCTIYEVGESDDGRLFLAMALYEGETLKARLAREGALTLSDALEITRQIAHGLKCAHAAGIVHRDLKPGNVMLLPGGTVKILDFGLAKARDQSASDTGDRFGTVAYMAPEQVRGEVVDCRADLWAVGVVLYEMLTGRKPFGGEHEVAIARAILDHEPVWVSTLHAEVPAAVEDLVRTLLHKGPAERYAAADELLAALSRVEAPAESADRRAGTGGLRARRILSRKDRWMVAVGATAATGVLGVVLGAALLAGRNRAGDLAAVSRVVVLPFENRTAVAELDPLGTMVAEWVTQGLTAAPFLTVLDTRGAQAAVRTLGAAAEPVSVGRETGAGVVVAGSYFLQADSLQFQAQIASTADGSVLLGIGEVAAPRDRPLDGVERLRQRVLAALASLNDQQVTTFQTRLANPPTYAAYREYTEGLGYYVRTAFPEAMRRFARAAALDSGFLLAQVWAAQSAVLAQFNSGEGWARVADSLISGLRPVRHRLSAFDRARLDYVVALHAHDLDQAHRAALHMEDAAPGSVDARREAALSAKRVFRTREARRRLEALDQERGLMRAWGQYWSVLADVHHQLGEYRDELAVVRRARRLYPAYFRARELRALAALGRVTEVDSIARAELPGAPAEIGRTAFGVAGELMAHGHPHSARGLARYAAELLTARPPSEQTAQEWLDHHIRLGLSFVGYRGRAFPSEPSKAASPLQEARDAWLHQRAELALLLGDAEGAAEHAAQLRYPEAHALLRARILAARGDHDAARAALEEIERRVLDAGGTLRALGIERVGVFVRLGEPDRALEVFADGLFRGLFPLYGQDGHAYPDLAPLWNDARFKELIEPRG